ncbi:MAG: FAD/NAD(P)-binding protein [Acidobacteriota bacterium]
MVPRPFRVRRLRKETADTFNLELEPADNREVPEFLPGQFNMLYLFGIGESAISISGDPAQRDPLIHTIRAVGTVTRGLAALKRGHMVGVRGPFGTAWPVASAVDHDVVVVAGGIGLAPLRPAIYQLLAQRPHYGRLVILYGSRSPDDLLFARELERWRGRFDLEVLVTVDHATSGWRGHVGVVTSLIQRMTVDPLHTIALTCGPEVMMRFATKALVESGVAPDHIYVSMERNMKCAIGWCGHCQLGPTFVCKDGPVFPLPQIAPLWGVREM